MAKNTERVAYLIINKEDFKRKVADRLAIGQEFLTRKISDLDGKDKCWKEFMDWDHYNLEMIKQAFEYPDNVYGEEYKRHTGAPGAYFGGSYTPPSFEESLENIRKEMGYQVSKLKRFGDKIELLRVKPGSTILVEASQLDNLLRLLKRFHKVVQELRDRRADREPVLIVDEYDVQYVLKALLKLYFNDVRPEEFSPSHAGANTRIDFVLKEEGIVLETKMTHERLKAKALGEELLIDIGRYKNYPDCTDLVIFIYDKGDHIINKQGFAADLEQQSTPGFKVSVVIIPD
ncbi:hypothetical protein [Mucilaginibacter rubeus]|uniref:Uncharacterized protein n=1 Tax=Mucilaginibacter rubeus TaxID=2027860 RepID=A0A5C1HUC5_9SPHI|nr:hypothetical protein [Mucilaginibacter rubeus]QEM09189.1 hypothetical protein DEO27_003880 [Mucilaginibacter rubeus]